MSALPELDVADVAAALHMHRNTAYRKMRAEGWPHVRIGQRIWFTQAHLDRIIAMHTVDPEPEPEPSNASTWGRVGRGRR